jgi:phospholipid/cholesterol/gamma-HCH transport system substrate-binding protein
MMATNEISRNLRVGGLVAISAATLMIFLFFIGSEQKLFSKKSDYHVRLDSVSGLAQGNPVMLSGVTVGTVKDIRLSRDPKLRTVFITISIESKYRERVRQDSRARLKKLGLIAADAFIDVTPGSPNLPALPPGSFIPAARQTNVDALIASGEDLVDNFVQISHSMKNILERVDRGEGLIGELTTEPQTKQRLTDTMLATLSRADAILAQVQSGRGLLGKLVYDESYGDQLASSVDQTVQSLQSVIGNVQHSFESGEGMLPALLNDPEGREKVRALVENMRLTSENLAAFSVGLRTGDGLLPRLINDKEVGDATLEDFQQLVHRLNEVARKLDEGGGTAGRLVADPAIYESVNDILIGINESRLLRWLIRNRQGAGIKTRYEAAQEGAAPAPAGEPKPQATPEAPPVDAPPAEVPPAAAPEPESPPAAPEEPKEVPPVPPAEDPVPPNGANR